MDDGSNKSTGKDNVMVRDREIAKRLRDSEIDSVWFQRHGDRSISKGRISVINPLVPLPGHRALTGNNGLMLIDSWRRWRISDPHIDFQISILESDRRLWVEG